MFSDEERNSTVGQKTVTDTHNSTKNIPTFNTRTTQIPTFNTSTMTQFLHKIHKTDTKNVNVPPPIIYPKKYINFRTIKPPYTTKRSNYKIQLPIKNTSVTQKATKENKIPVAAIPLHKKLNRNIQHPSMNVVNNNIPTFNDISTQNSPLLSRISPNISGIPGSDHNITKNITPTFEGVVTAPFTGQGNSLLFQKNISLCSVFSVLLS